MISSMTGFGKSVFQKNGYSVETEIKSVNSRYLDLSVKLPRNLSQYELDLREKIKKNISRGKLYINISLKKEGVDEGLGELNPDAVSAGMKLLNQIKETAKIDSEISLDNLLVFQNYFFTDTEKDHEEEYNVILESVNQAITQLEEMRKKEGRELAGDILGRLELIENYLNKIKSISKESINEYFEKVKERAKQLVADIIDNQDRLMQELAFLSEKYDVTEECVRLDSHIKMFREAIDEKESSGRRLNFICQEMNREANTINSKSVSSEISSLGISIKEELEKIREQIQNIE